MPSSEIIKVEFKQLPKKCWITEVLENIMTLQTRALFHLTEKRCFEGTAHDILESTGHIFSSSFK